MQHNNLRSASIEAGILTLTYEDETLAIQEFTIDPNAAAFEDQNIPVRNETGLTLSEGALVYVSGWDVANSEVEADLAEAGPSDAHLAQFVVRTDILDAASGFVYKSHTLGSLDTSGSADVGNGVHRSTGHNRSVLDTSARAITIK